MGERYVDVGKVRSRSGSLRSVRASAHSARSQPPPQPPLTSRSPSPSSVVLRLGIGSRGSAGTRRWASTSPAGTLRDPRRPQDPGRPTSTDVNRHAAERSAKSSSGVAECPAGHRAGSPRRAPRRPASSQFLYQGSPPRSLSETARVRSRACRIFRFTPASAIDTASCRSS